MSVSYMTHPLIRHKITLLRKEDTSTNEFRKLVEEIAMLMGYEALSDLETQDITVKTPIEESVQPVISGKKLAVVPILRKTNNPLLTTRTAIPPCKIKQNI